MPLGSRALRNLYLLQDVLFCIVFCIFSALSFCNEHLLFLSSGKKTKDFLKANIYYDSALTVRDSFTSVSHLEKEILFFIPYSKEDTLTPGRPNNMATVPQARSDRAGP